MDYYFQLFLINSQKDKRSQPYQKKSSLLSKLPLINRPSRKAVKSSKTSKFKVMFFHVDCSVYIFFSFLFQNPLDSSSGDSYEEKDNIDSDPDFVG